MKYSHGKIQHQFLGIGLNKYNQNEGYCKIIQSNRIAGLGI